MFGQSFPMNCLAALARPLSGAINPQAQMLGNAQHWRNRVWL
jgi:hypothetical protein